MYISNTTNVPSVDVNVDSLGNMQTSIQDE